MIQFLCRTRKIKLVAWKLKAKITRRYAKGIYINILKVVLELAVTKKKI